ncbi:exported hypothetical protein [Candidatus Sulfotelmatobacter kueseliae]|uniref:Big-1 domain-containing protein n=1 Tax=Candidatus Sulfotelmatobacter kueseliae TaxID=2042962 RepID=A0A2U3LDP7_9BACT|nr:exported hypothetical protein [Candidatus Sulfotelmatobacter kueseliae]
MNRKTYGILGLALVSLAFGFLTGCSSSSAPPPPTIAITATGGATQTQTITEAFPTALGVNVTSNGSPATGVTVTFAPPSSGATCTPSATTATTDSSGNASITCTASSTPGAYSVTATATGATTPASFSLTNAPPSVFTFYVSGLEAINEAAFGGPNYYALAGAVAFDVSGNTFPDANGNCGEQDYNDGDGITSPTTGDTIAATGSSMTVNMTTGTGTLVLATNNTNLGVAGIETFTVQFVNASHALITQFDGSATSSGSMDLQSATTDSNFAFTISGTDLNYAPVGYGGIFSVGTGGALTGTADQNDNGTVTPDNALAGSVTAQADAYGRGTASITINGVTLSLVYYNVTAEAMRLIDVDAGGASGAGSAAIGSAYGQGATPAFDSTALGTADVFGVQGNSWGVLYAETGSLVTSGAATGIAPATFSSGEGDGNWEGYVSTPTAPSTPNVSGSYTIASNGYGGATINGLAPVALPYGLYATLSSVNLMDPNNTSGGGGALALDLYPSFSGGTGVIVPQGTIASDGSDLNNSYGFGAQEFNDVSTLPVAPDYVGWEFDYVGQGTFATLALTGTGVISDPFGYFVSGTAGLYGTPTTPIPFAGTAAAPDAAGRYAFPAAGTAGNFAVGPVGTNTTANAFTVVMYEASPALVFSIDEDETATPTYSLWLGTFQEQSASSLKAMHVKHGAVPKAQAKRKH